MVHHIVSKLLAVPLALAAVTSATNVSVAVGKTGSFTLSVDGATWFTSGDITFTSGNVTKSVSNGTLVLRDTQTSSDFDSLGAYTSTMLVWDNGNYVTTFKQYADAVVFEQSFPNGANDTSLDATNFGASRDKVSTSFPTLVPASSSSLGYLAFSGDMTGSGYKYGTLSAGTDTKIGTCRITQSVSKLHASEGGYNAWTPIPGSNPVQYVEHQGDYCDCTGTGSCSHWVYSKEDMTQADCQAKCTSLGCACFDWGAGGSSVLPTGVTGFGPAAIYSQDLKSSVVISSFSQFMAASAAPAKPAGIAYGLQGSFTSIPAGFSLSYIVAASPKGGVNEAFESWGDKLLTTYQKSREMTYRDYSLNYLGYSTDNGAFYYYQTEDHTPGKRGPPYTPGKTYEETLIDVKDYADSMKIPYKYVLLDSWWYYQGEGSGVTDWIGRPDIFPHGNDYLRNQTGWPIMGHNRFWAVDNVYAKQNGGDYEFVIEKKGDAPENRNYGWPSEQRFWDDLMYNSSKWGLFMYEQDWLDTEYDNVVHLNKDPSAARTWLLQMGTAAARNDLTIQYCMSHCRHILQSVEIPAVTNARASGDYHAGSDQWKPLGTTGIFGWSVAIAPTKDNYWSTDVQTGSAYGDYATIKEPYNRLQAAVSTLSKGPVAPSDKIGSSNAELILRSCASDGRLLQGDKPAMVLNKLHQQRAFGSMSSTWQTQTSRAGLDATAIKESLIERNEMAGDEIWATHTNLDGFNFATVLGAVLANDTEVSFADDLNLDGKYVAFEANTTGSIVTGSSITLKACPSKWDFQLYNVAPVLPNGWALLGEQSKWVSVSAARFSRLSYYSGSSGSGASVVATGPQGESVSVSWLQSGKMAPTVVTCTIPRGGSVVVDTNGGCTQV